MKYLYTWLENQLLDLKFDQYIYIYIYMRVHVCV